MCAACIYWQFRVYLENAQRKRSTGDGDRPETEHKAKLVYAEMLQTTLNNRRKAL
jgi:hypothetical protein